MLRFESSFECLAFYRRCEAWARSRRAGRREVAAEFPAWALLHASPNRSRVDLLWIDYLRQELGTRGSARSAARFIAMDADAAGASAATDAAITSTQTQEAEVLLVECLAAAEAVGEGEAIRLVVLEGLSLAEAAATLGVSKTRVRQRLERVARRVR